MKLMKAMKKLKFWPRMKKRKKYHFLPPSSPPPPPPSRPPPPLPYYHNLHSHYEPLLPSAPPLPPWMEFEETGMDQECASNGSHLSSAGEEIQDIEKVIVEGDIEVVPELKKLETRKRGELLMMGGFGCVVSFGEHLVRCVFPCFIVPEKGGQRRQEAAMEAD